LASGIWRAEAKWGKVVKISVGDPMAKRSRCSIGRGWLGGSLLALTLLACGAGAVSAQSLELIHAYEAFDAAKSAGRTDEALKTGDEALTLTATDGGAPHDLEDLCMSLGELAMAAGDDRRALTYYQRALSLQEAELGSENPDLVRTLNAIGRVDVKLNEYTDAAAALKRALAIERAAFGESHENTIATLTELRAVYESAKDADGVAEVTGELAAAATKKRGLSGVQGKLVVDSKRYAITKDGFAKVRVVYGTNRLPTEDARPAQMYGNGNGTLQTGFLEVTIPQVHQLAELEAPKDWSAYTMQIDKTEARKRYVLLDTVTPLAHGDFVTALRRQISGSPGKDVFIFVHGYNTSFEDAARRTAQLAYDLDFDGTPLMYSWPSQAHLYSYLTDQQVIEPTGPRLAEFLDTVTSASGAERVHLIAHSMGNRVMIAALQSYLKSHPNKHQHPAFGQLVFTAPDVDRKDFVDAFASLRGIAERITLYASDSDKALWVSKAVHGAQPRAGSAGEGVILLPGLDTIDMSGLPADALGHSYFAASGGAVYDLLHLLWRNDPPESPQRCNTSTTKRNAPAPAPLWRFNVDKCKGSDLLEAGVLMKQYQNQGPAQIVQLVTAQIAALTDPTQRQAAQLILTRLNALLGVAN
jgi:esterase/lipase superfamily enzyme